MAKFFGCTILTFFKLFPFSGGRSSQNDEFTVKTLYKWQILELAVKCEQLDIYTQDQDLTFDHGIASIENLFYNVYCFYCLFTVFKQ